MVRCPPRELSHLRKEERTRTQMIAALLLLACIGCSEGEYRPASITYQDPDDVLRRGVSLAVSAYASNERCRSVWRPGYRILNSRRLRVMPVMLAPNKGAGVVCQTPNRIYVNVGHMGVLRPNHMAHIIVHETAHLTFCDSVPEEEWGKPSYKQIAESYARTVEMACFGELLEDMNPYDE